MSLHSYIMNLPALADDKLEALYGGAGCAPSHIYRSGHRDARHAAAELAQQADAELARLRDDHEGLKWERDRLSDAVNGERAEVARLRAKCERLRVALDKIAERTGSDDPCRRLVEIARAALTPGAPT